MAAIRKEKSTIQATINEQVVGREKERKHTLQIMLK
jgi:hypothetical protein